MNKRIILMVGLICLKLSLSYSFSQNDIKQVKDSVHKAHTFNAEVSGLINFKKYICPPCGCPHDSIIYNQPGLCTSCKMHLIDAPEGLAYDLDKAIAPTLKGVKFYLIYAKLIYPIFVISILLSVFLLFLMIKNKSLNVFLIAIILSLALYAFQNQLYDTNRGYSSHWRSLFTPFSTILAIGPLLFFYVKAILSNSFRWKKLYWLHFLPALLMFLFYCFILFSSKSIQQQFMSSPHDTVFSHIEQIIAVLSSTLYLIFAFLLFKKWKELKGKNIRLTTWLNRFFIGMTVLFLVWSGMLFIDFWIYDFQLLTINYNPLWYIITIVLIWLTIEIFLNPKFFLLKKQTSYYVKGSKIMTNEQILQYESDLISLMENQKLFTDPNLSLNKLAQELGVNSKYLSNILNNTLDKNFYDFINYYRIEEAKKLLKDSNYKNLTIEAISNKSGFKSKSSFNSAFKKYAKMTPREYMGNFKN